jgi:hypothetical protein
MGVVQARNAESLTAGLKRPSDPGWGSFGTDCWGVSYISLGHRFFVCRSIKLTRIEESYSV